MRSLAQTLRVLVWLTQLGLSVAVPLVGLILLGVWLHKSCGWGGWTIPVGVLLGLLGAAGGLGASLCVFLNAEIRSGVEEVLSIAQFDKTAKDADIIITGEGKIDGQSKDGKVVSGVIAHAHKLGVPVIAVVGTAGEGYEALYEKGLKGVFSIIDSPSDLSRILSESENLYRKTAKSILGLLEIT